MHLVLYNSQGKAQILYEISVAAVFEAQPYFSAVFLIRREVGKKKLNIIKETVNSTSENIAARLVRKAFYVLTRFGSTEALQFVVDPYMWLNPRLMQFQRYCSIKTDFSPGIARDSFQSCPPLLRSDR